MSRVIEVVRRGPRGTDGIAGASGAKIFISSQDASASATLNFTGFDGAAYDGYEFWLSNIIPATDAQPLILRTSANGGSSYDATSGDYHWSAHTVNSGGTGAYSGSTSLAYYLLGTNVGNAAGEEGVSGVLTIKGPHLTKKTQMDFQGELWTAAGVFTGSETWGVRNSAAVVNACQFLFLSGNITSGTITMYGLKNSA
jgi:hypothetical protein